MKDYKFWINLGYVLMGAWTLAASIYIGTEMIEQHAIFAELDAIEHASEGWKQDADTLIDRGKIGILYCLQELQRDPEKSDYFLAARALEKAGGRFRDVISESDKNALRKLISEARFALANTIDTGGEFPPRAQAILQQSVKVLNRYDEVELYRRFEKARTVTILTSLAANEEVDDEAALYIRDQFEMLLERLDRAIAGEAFLLFPEEKKLISLVIDYCQAYLHEDKDLRQLHYALKGVEEVAGQRFGILTERETFALKRLAVEIPGFDPELEPDSIIDVPAEIKEKLKEKAAAIKADLPEYPDYTWDYLFLSAAASGFEKLAGAYTAELSDEEQQQMLALLKNEDLKKEEVPVDLITNYTQQTQTELSAKEVKATVASVKKLRERYQAKLEDTYRQPDTSYLEGSLRGLYALLGKDISYLTNDEYAALKKLVVEKEFEQKLPIEKLNYWLSANEPSPLENKWVSENPVYFWKDERNQLLAASDEFFARYEASRRRMAEVTYRYIKKLTEEDNRFREYPVTEKKELQEKAGAFEIIAALWKKTEERVMMIDLIDICGTRNEEVRSYMEKALITIGEPATPNLLRALRREKIDQALAAPTAYRTKLERLRELNDTNTLKRLSCLRVLSVIGGDELEDVFVPLVDEKNPDIAEAAAEALKKM